MSDTESKKRSRSVSQSSPLDVSGSALQSTWGAMGVRPTKHRVPARGTNYFPSPFICSWPASSIKGRSASRLVNIVPCSLPSQPTNLGDFRTEFSCSQSNTYNALFFGTWYTLRLSTREPNAVVIQPPADSNVIVPIKVKIETATKMGNTAKLNELPSKLRNLTFKVRPVLRAKMFLLDRTLSKDAGPDNADPQGYAPFKGRDTQAGSPQSQCKFMRTST